MVRVRSSPCRVSVPAARAAAVQRRPAAEGPARAAATHQSVASPPRCIMPSPTLQPQPTLQTKRRAEVLDEVLKFTPPMLHRWCAAGGRQLGSGGCRPGPLGGACRMQGPHVAASVLAAVERRSSLAGPLQPPGAQDSRAAAALLLHPRRFLGKWGEPAAWLNARLAYTRTAGACMQGGWGLLGAGGT